MTTERDARAYLTDMLDASDKAMGFVRGMTYEEFTDDERTAFAVIRALEILGEAAGTYLSRCGALIPMCPGRPRPICAISSFMSTCRSVFLSSGRRSSAIFPR